VKLSVNLIDGSRYWLAGTEIADEDVPAHLRRYAEVKKGATEEKREPAPSVAGTKPKATR
jgi:hypothetical protein